MTRYNPADIEPKWQKKWADGRRYVAPDVSDKPKYYVTGMFPYPSGAGMHTGHFFEHAIVDAVARFRRALGYNVMYPMGWDSFGLPAENYAIKTGKPPAETTVTNIENFKNQLRRVGSSIDWNREVNTADPEYYQWTQWVFTKLFERGLAYQKEANQWWCPVDKTVLANEQVVNGRCWRCDSLVVKKPMKQWFFKITDYADALLDEIPDLDWPEKIKLAQTNWIGKSKGAEVEFAIAQGESRVMRHESRDSLKFTPELTQMIVDGKRTSTIRLEPKNLQVGDWAEFMTRDGEEVTHFGYAKITKIRTLALRDIPNDLPGHEPMLNDEQKLAKYKGYYDDTVTLNTNFTIYNFEFDHDSCLMTRDSIKVFTTRPDTLFGATFLVLAPEHPLVKQLTTEEQRSDVEAYVSEAIKRSEIERMSEGKEKTGIFTGGYAINPLTNEKIPVWVADYVLWGYGTGAIMAVPAHDERDYAFAKKFDLPVTEVIAPDFGMQLPDAVDVEGSVVIGYDPKTKQYMSLINNNNGLTWFASGGLNDGETFEQAARRELAEEAGYHDIMKLIRLGGPTYSYYYNSNKKSNRRSFSYTYIAIIDSNEKTSQAQESHENYQVVWSDFESLYRALQREQDETGDVGHWIDGLERAKSAVAAYEAGDEYAGPMFGGDGVLFNSGSYSGLNSAEARELIVQHLEREGKGREKVTYRMRDWLISRQRYWGAPIPIIHCPEHGAVAVPENDLPVILPEVEDFAPRGDGKSVLAAQEEWVNTVCPTCGGPALRETDTMDGYACSSWYLLRYTDPHNSEQAWSPEKAAYWSPLDMYIGGDHAVAHLLYVRFWSHVFYDMKLVPTKEPVKKLVYHGLIQAEDGTKMSKSKGNTIDPLEVIDAGYGADALRTFELFLGPINENSNWSSRGIGGVYRFLNRFWTLTQEYIASSKDTTGDSKELLNVTHAAIKKVTDDALQLDFNTAISTLMECVNKLYKLKLDGFTPEWQFVIESLVKLLQPFAPHMSAELWEQLGHDTPLDTEPWPQYDEKYLVKDTVTVVLQVNGKVRATIDVPAAATKEELEHLALENNRVREFVAGKKPTRVVVVPGRLVNVVV